MTYAEQFAKAFPKALDFHESEYKQHEQEILRAATENGYRLAGFRLRRAVFTSKPK